MTTIFTFCGIALVFITGYNLYIWLDSHENNKQKKVIKVTKSLYHLPKEYRFNDYKYWVDHDGYHNYCHVDGSNGAITMNVRDMRKHDPIFKELNDLYYKAIGHTPQWLRDERKEESFNNISILPQSRGTKYWIDGLSDYRPSLRTQEIIDQHYTQQQMKKIIKYIEAQQSIDLACKGEWQPKLAKLWGADIAMKKDIEVSEELYQECIKDANKEQYELLDKIFGKDVKYKVGDHVITKGYSSEYDGRVLKITKYTSSTNAFFFEVLDSGYYNNVHNSLLSHIIRHATPEETKKAQYLPEGTPCFVRDAFSDSWKLHYADGNGRFYGTKKMSGMTFNWKQFRKYSDGLPEE